ncbi:MAG TPA: hypothetical protein VK505_07160 [Steroidobacteraceae bacterium]|nr:hypothetical protein [Steroidobacteraceae bacterium]
MTQALAGRSRRAGALTALLIFLAALGACSHVARLGPSHWHWPWRHAPAPPEPAVSELLAEFPAGASAAPLGQSWNRNNLRVALTALSGEGDFSLRPLPGHAWPIRLEFLVQPGSFAHLEIRGDERVILSVPATGEATVLAVPLGIYSAQTGLLRLHFGP